MYSVTPRRRGLSGEVPHWYCYIPFFPSADCWKSFGKGTAELIGGTVGAAVSGAASSAAEQLGGGDSPDGKGTNWGMWLLLGAVGIFGVITLATPGPRRYGR